MISTITIHSGSNPQSLIGSSRQKLTLADMADETKHYVDKEGSNMSWLKIKQNWTFFFFLKDPAPPDISPFPLPDPLPTPRFTPFPPARPTPPTCRAGQAVAPELRCTPPAPRGARLPSLAPDGNHGGRRDATRMDGRRSGPDLRGAPRRPCRRPGQADRAEVLELGRHRPRPPP